MNKTEGNALLSKFLDIPPVDFHEDWTHLMAVVEKIEGRFFEVIISNHSTMIIDRQYHATFNPNRYHKSDSSISRIEACWNACVHWVIIHYSEDIAT